MTVLPFYTSTGMRDAERVSSQDALLCPVHKFLPWQIQRSHLADTYLDEITLVDCDDNETDVLDYFSASDGLVSGWTNGGVIPGEGYSTFTPSGVFILSAIESGSGKAYCYSEEFSLATGDSIIVDYNFTLNSGTLPNVRLGNSVGTFFSLGVDLSDGEGVVYLTATSNSSGSVRLLIVNDAGNDTNFYVSGFSSKLANIELTEKTSYDFFTYNGTPLSTTIPYGVYYLRVSDGNTTWYSEWFSVQDLQPQLITGWPSESYDTFTYSVANITSAITATTASAESNTLTIRTDEIFIFTYDLTLTSGSLPNALFVTGSPAVSASNTEALSEGLGEVELTCTRSTAAAKLRIASTSASSFSLSSVSLRRKWGDYVHLEFTNTRDFNNGADSIYYAGGFTQQAYLRSYENLPIHETIEMGQDKNGKFEAEKLIRKLTRSMVAYVSRSMHNALSLLKLHDSVKILNERGVEYTPEIGNVDVSMDWNTFDTGTLRIAFNEDGTVWTNSSDNIS